MFFRHFARKGLGGMLGASISRMKLPVSLGAAAGLACGDEKNAYKLSQPSYRHIHSILNYFPIESLNKLKIIPSVLSKIPSLSDKEVDSLRYAFLTKEDDLETSKLFIEAYITKYGDVNIQLECVSLLRLPAMHNCLEIVKMLVEKYHADVSTDPLLISSVLSGNVANKEMIVYLLHHGASLDDITFEALFPNKKEDDREKRSETLEYLLRGESPKLDPKFVYEALYHSYPNYTDVVFSQPKIVNKILPHLHTFNNFSNYGTHCNIVHKIGASTSRVCPLSTKAVEDYFDKLAEIKYPFNNENDAYGLIRAARYQPDNILKIFIKYIWPNFAERLGSVIEKCNPDDLTENEYAYDRINRLAKIMKNESEEKPSMNCRI